MDLLLVRLARSPRPSAEALRSALLAQPWLVPDSARRGPWARPFGFPGGVVHVAAKLGDASWYAGPGLSAQLLPDAEVGIVPTRAALDALHDRLQHEHETRAQRNLREVLRREEALARQAEQRPHDALVVEPPRPALPRRPRPPEPASLHVRPPPLPPPGVVPLLARAELRKEGREMTHFVGSYWRRVERGEYAVYRVLAPERATLALRWHKTRGLWWIDQIRGHANVGVRAETRLYLRDWVETGVVDPAAARWAREHARRHHQMTLARLQDAVDEADRAEIRKEIARLRMGELPEE